MKDKETLVEPVSIAMSRKLKERIRKRAERMGISMSSCCRMLIESALKEAREHGK